MNGSDTNRLTIGTASAEERAAALALVFGHLPRAQQRRHVANLVQSAEDGQTLWIAKRGGRLVAAMRAVVQPGRTAAITPPAAVPEESTATLNALVARVVDDLGAREVTLAQALFSDAQTMAANALQSSGFRHLTNLLYMVSLGRRFPDSPPADELEFVGYEAVQYERLAGIVLRTYEKSLDCPAVDRIRDIADVLAGYRATGAFDPARWLVVRRAGIDIGCLLLTDYPRDDQWELVYMGLVPEARGHGWGTAMVRHAQWMAREAGRNRLVLAVDSANAPALAVYAACGFVTWDVRGVLLRVFDGDG